METLIPLLFIILIINAVISSVRKFFASVLQGMEQVGIEGGNAETGSLSGTRQTPGSGSSRFLVAPDSGSADLVPMPSGQSGSTGDDASEPGGMGSVASGLANMMKKRLAAAKKSKKRPAEWWSARHEGDLARRAEGVVEKALAIISTEGPAGISRAGQWLKANQPSSTMAPEERRFLDSLTMGLNDLVTKNRKFSEAAQEKIDATARGVARRGKAGPLSDLLQNRSALKNSIIISEILKPRF